MKIHYIFHSSYLVELSECYLLFDYYQGDMPELDHNKPLYIMASHQHYDHFSPVIFRFMLKYPDCEYILSDDISREMVQEALDQLGLECNIHWVHEGDRLVLPKAELDIFSSTDVGVSYLVHSDSSRIFHAGDLNDWHWPNVPASENEKMRENFLSILTDIKGCLEGEKIDVAFFPLDPVQGSGCFVGPTEFLEEIPVKMFLPMHMWEQYSICGKFLAARPEYEKIFRPVHGAGEEIETEETVN